MRIIVGFDYGRAIGGQGLVEVYYSLKMSFKKADGTMELPCAVSSWGEGPERNDSIC